MSVINKKPFIEEVLEKLTQENLETLVELMNGGEGNVTFKSFINDLYSMSVSDKGIKRMILEVKDRIFTGYLIYNNSNCVLICYTNEYAQKMFIVDLDYENKKYTIVDEQITINEFRRLVEGRTTNLIVEANDVKANPTLAGNEENLSSIEIDGTKFKIGGGGNTLKLYRHSFSFDVDITFTDFQDVEKTVLTTFRFVAISDKPNAIPNYASIMSNMNSVKFLTPVTAKFKVTDYNAFCYCIGSNVTATGIFQSLDALLCFRDTATGSQVKFKFYQTINSSKQKNFKDNVTPFNFVE